jgi:hypothetical protein
MLKLILERQDAMIWTGFIWLRITIGFREHCNVGAQLAASEEGLRSLELCCLQMFRTQHCVKLSIVSFFN